MATKNLNLFPLGVATGPAHCNRVEEREQLQKNILGLTHTWLWARRRMGKTSLIEQVLRDISHGQRKVVALTIDLLVVHDEEELEERIREGVEQLGVQILPQGQKATTRLAKAFGRLNPTFSTGAMGVKITLTRPAMLVPGIADMLMALDDAAGMYRRRLVIVLDEFQQLTQLKDSGSAAEGAIRHAVERSKNIAYLFAGSEKHLLASMFENEDRPLYRLCRKMALQRIKPESYREFIRNASKARWRRILPDTMIDRLLALSARHPYYVNALCARLWERDKLPTSEHIANAWRDLIEEDRSLVAARVLRLSASQRAMLKAIAQEHDGVEHPTSRQFLSKIRLPASTGNKAKEVLEQEDLVRQDEQGKWFLVDPVMAAYLCTL